MKPMSMRIGNIEVRTTGPHLLNDGNPPVTAEIICWETASNFVIAYWERDGDGFCLKFVDARPFRPEIEMSDFWKLARMGQEYLDESGEQR